jgi:Uma2 family endonuclease
MAMYNGLNFSDTAETAELVFPVEELVPESKRHLKLRTLLYQVLELAFADRAAIGSDQFVYWDATNPKRCLAPDVFVRFGQPDSLFDSWKTWERGVPEMALEIISDSDERDRDWDGKLSRYAQLGVTELVRFDPSASNRLLRVWDLIDGALVERNLTQASTPSRCLPGHWLIHHLPELGPSLRLSRDAHGADLYPTPAEQHAETAEQHAKVVERVRELEAELKRRDHA